MRRFTLNYKCNSSGAGGGGGGGDSTPLVSSHHFENLCYHECLQPITPKVYGALSRRAFRGGREAVQRACREARKVELQPSLEWRGLGDEGHLRTCHGTAHCSPVCLKPGDLQPPAPTPSLGSTQGFSSLKRVTGVSGENEVG